MHPIPIVETGRKILCEKLEKESLSSRKSLENFVA